MSAELPPIIAGLRLDSARFVERMRKVRAAAAEPVVDLVTVPDVELLEVGTFDTSTGRFTWALDDLQAAVAAFDDVGYRTPVLKLGHVDPRFDGQPAIGRIGNVRLSTDKQTLLGDYLGMPRWLAEALPSAFPDRSIEGEFGLTTATGTKHRFALTAVALLGVTEPAIATLEDIENLFTGRVAASGAPVLVSFRRNGGPLVPATDVRAAISVDDVRSAFYEQIKDTPNPWAWIRELYAGDGAFLIVDNDEGELYRIPWSESNGEVTFGSPEEVVVQYVPAPPDAEDEAEQSGLVLLARNVPLTQEEAMTPEQLEAIGLAADATPEQIIERQAELGALAAAERDAARAQLDEATPPAPPPPAPPTPPSDPSTPPPSSVDLPEGFVAVPQSAVQEMALASKRLETLEAERHVRERTAFLARYERKFAPAQRASMERVYDTSGSEVLASMLDKAPDVVPTKELGHGDEGVSTEDDAVYAALFGTEGS